MRVLVIVTKSIYKLWDLTGTPDWQVASDCQVTEVRVRRVSKDKIAVLLQAETGEFRKITTGWLEQISTSESALCAPDAKLYMALHSEAVDLRAIRSAVAKDKLAAGALFSHENNFVYTALKNLLEQPGVETFEAALEAVKKGQELTQAQRLSTLKHRLAHLFLPVSVDLMAWEAVGFNDEYMKELRQAYSEADDRFTRARQLLYGAAEPDEGESVRKIVIEAGLQQQPMWREMWREIMSLLPPKEPNTDAVRERCHLYLEAQHVLSSLNDRAKLETVRVQLAAGENPFSQWCAKLDTALMNIRDMIEKHP